MSPTANRAVRRHPPKQYPAYPRTSTPLSRMLRTKPATIYSGLSRTTLFKYAAEGLLHPVRLGQKLLLWDPAELDGLLR